MKTVAVTGANGFVGQHLLSHLGKGRWISIPLVRRAQGLKHEVITGDLQSFRNLEIGKIDSFVHLAARTHVLNEKANDPLAEYRNVNVAGTIAALKIAHLSRAKHFIFLSSVKANGEETANGSFFSEQSPENPQDHYGITKLEAEQEVKSYCERHGMAWTIIRTPLIYGRGVKANFEKLARLVETQIPLPFGKINNLRSIIFVENLADFILFCLNNKSSYNNLFFVDDGQPLSTKDILRYVAMVKNKKLFLLPFPKKFMKLAFSCIGRRSLFNKLFCDLVVSSSKANLIGWKAPFTSQQGFELTFT